MYIYASWGRAKVRHVLRPKEIVNIKAQRCSCVAAVTGQSSFRIIENFGDFSIIFCSSEVLPKRVTKCPGMWKSLKWEL